MDGYLIFNSNQVFIYEGSSVLINNVIKGIANGYRLNQAVYQSIGKIRFQALLQIDNQKKAFIVKKKLPVEMSMFDYYVIAMAIMTGMFTCLSSSMSFTEERKNRTMNRLIIAPINKGKVFFVKCIGQIPFAMLQMGILLLVSYLFFDVKYAATFMEVLLLFALLLSITMVCNIVGVFVSLVFRKSMVVYLFIISWLMLLFSGCFAKAMTLEPICNYLPPYLVRVAAFDLNLFGNKAPAIRIIIVNAFVIIGLMFLGGWIFSNKQEERV